MVLLCRSQAARWRVAVGGVEKHVHEKIMAPTRARNVSSRPCCLESLSPSSLSLSRPQTSVQRGLPGPEVCSLLAFGWAQWSAGLGGRLNTN